TVTVDADGRQSQCAPAWTCRAALLRDDKPGARDYPFFRLMVWSDEDGWQRIKWSTGKAVTPFIDTGALAYSEPLKLVRRFGASAHVPDSGVTVLPSPNTGEKLTVFWRALPKDFGSLLGETMATQPLSLTNPVLPKHVQFAVVDRTGLVLFHSDAARSL